MSASRVADFLTRAQAITNKSNPIESTQPIRSGLRTLTNSPISLKKSSLSPISYQSFSSTHDDTPQPQAKKLLLSGTFNLKKPIAGKEKLEKNQKNSKDLKQKFEAAVVLPLNNKKNSFKPKEGLISQNKEEKDDNKLNVFNKSPEMIEQLKELEQKNSKKVKKMVEIFKQEALKMDQKLQFFGQENKRLKEILSNPQLPSAKKHKKTVKDVINCYISFNDTSKYINILDNLSFTTRKHKNFIENDGFIDNWFECLDVPDEDLNLFLGSVCKKIFQEQQKRLKTEEETAKMIEFEESMIRELEAKVAKAETLARKVSNKCMAEVFDNDEAQFDRNLALENLNSLLSKNRLDNA